MTPDGEMPADPNIYFAQEFLERGIFRAEDISAGCHCIAPDYLADQLERSRQNLGVGYDRRFLPAQSGDAIERGAGGGISAADSRGVLVSGVGRRDEEDPGVRHGYVEFVSRRSQGCGIFYRWRRWWRSRSEVAGDDHHFRFVQLPFNLAMPEALTRPNQMVGGQTMPMVQAARDAGIALVTSAALLQGQLTKNLPPFVNAALGLKDNATLALQFARSVPGLTTALVGMSQVPHVKANLELVGVEPASREQFLKLFESKH